MSDKEGPEDRPEVEISASTPTGDVGPSASGSTEPTKTNRLDRESSPYLLLHQHNPVDWYPWGEEALERAKAENKPIFLSVGYSTCYWCHVMERESFSDPGIASFMNERFVNIKVDREERPDVDEIYMAATQILSGQGGWPNSLFLTPDLKPYYAGTYFPPRDMQGRPGFPTVVTSLADAWRDRRDDVRVQADEVAEAMRRVLQDRFEPGVEPPPADAPLKAFERLAESFDQEAGGFGRAPKFPTPSNLFLLDSLARLDDLVRTQGDAEVAERAGEMLSRSLDAMARGGIYDQLAGGFHRYATDSAWRIPHFEKMLYDNGLLLELYALEFERTGDPEAARIVAETVEFLDREMTSSDGAFWSAIDAETDGHEGAYYVWTRDEIDEALGAEDALFLAPIFGFDRSPFFEGSHYVLHLPTSLHRVAEERKSSREELLAEIEPLRAKLLAVRADRKRPLTDDKILADWNGMTIRGLAVAGRVLEQPEWIERASRAAQYVLNSMRDPSGCLLHSVRAGEGRISAYLSDYVFLTRGLLGLYEATNDSAWLDEAIRTTEEQIDRLADERGGFFNFEGGDDLLFRSQEIFDGATPAANAVAVLNLIDLAEATEGDRWLELAGRSLRAYSPMITGAPDAVRMLSMATGRWVAAGGVPASVETVASDEKRQVDQQPTSTNSTPVTISVDASEPDGDGFRTFEMELAIDEGWHLQANEVGEEFLQPTVVEARGFELRDIEYPAGERTTLGFRDEELSLYQGRVRIRGRMRRDPSRDEGELVVVYQACDDSRCLAPERVVVLRIG